jgi:hypothetical protein
MAAGTNFEGDRGANRLLNHNVRELVPYFLEDTVRRRTGSASQRGSFIAALLRCVAPPRGERAAGLSFSFTPASLLRVTRARSLVGRTGSRS